MTYNSTGSAIVVTGNAASAYFQTQPLVLSAVDQPVTYLRCQRGAHPPSGSWAFLMRYATAGTLVARFAWSSSGMAELHGSVATEAAKWVGTIPISLDRKVTHAFGVLLSADASVGRLL